MRFHYQKIKAVLTPSSSKDMIKTRIYKNQYVKYISIFFTIAAIAITAYFYISEDDKPSSSSIAPALTEQSTAKALTSDSLPAKIPATQLNSYIPKNNEDDEIRHSDFEKAYALANTEDFDKAILLTRDLALCLDDAAKDKGLNPLEEWRFEQCGYLSDKDLAAVRQLIPNLAARGNVDAKIHLFRMKLDEIADDKKSTSQAFQTSRQKTSGKEEVESIIKSVQYFANAGNSGAFLLLVDIYTNNRLVEINNDKALMYTLISEHDWSQPLLHPQDSTLVSASDDDMSRVLPAAIELFNNCCYGKVKKPLV
jgi:hypothetical protein